MRMVPARALIVLPDEHYKDGPIILVLVAIGVQRGRLWDLLEAIELFQVLMVDASP
jgi:hypothetical protein